jgi:hypothetical protein
MSKSTETRTPDRIRWEPARPLRAADLTAQCSASARARGTDVLHGHRTWGVLAGLGVALSEDLESVLIGRGVAYDTCGNELVVLDTTLLLPPPGERADAALVATAGGCAWRTPATLRRGLDVPLGHLRLDAVELWLDGAARVRCASQRRPVELRAGRWTTRWSDWTPEPGMFTLRVPVGFDSRAEPFWFATLEAGGDGRLGPPRGFLLSLRQADATGFTAVLVPATPRAVASFASPFVGPTIVWTAIGVRDDRP